MLQRNWPISIPADPTRTYALEAYCPGAARPYWSWTTSAWQAASDSTCLRLFVPCPDDPTWLLAWIEPPVWAGGGYLLRLVALDAAGNPIETIDVESVITSECS
jgi:hypothetical protein